MAQSAFARRQLEKHGWKEGDGLGKNKDGISKPLKASLKMDKTGVGHDPGSNFTDHWWLRVFNDAASSISNTQQTTKASDEQTSPQKNIYKGFVKGSVLNEGKEEKDSDCCSSDEETGSHQSSSGLPTLDDIHKFCGGATGSRAATLGIKMKGKLSRAAEQERLFNDQKMRKSISELENKDQTDPDPPELMKKKKKKKKKSKSDEANSQSQEHCFESIEGENINGTFSQELEISNTDVGFTKPENCIATGGIQSEDTELVSSKSKKHKKKKRKKVEELSLDDGSVSNENISLKKRKKLKYSDQDCLSLKDTEESSLTNTKQDAKEKKKKKKLM